MERSRIIHDGGSNIIGAFALELDGEWESLPFVPWLGTVLATLAALAHCGGLNSKTVTLIITFLLSSPKRKLETK